MIEGHICMGPIEFLALGALPLAAVSALLKERIRGLIPSKSQN